MIEGRKYSLYFFLTVLLWGGFTGCVGVLHAQVRSAQVTISTDSVKQVENGSIAAFTLKIENLEPSPFQGYIKINEIHGVSIVGRDRIPVQLSAQSSIYYPLRISISELVSAGSTSVAIQLVDQKQKLVTAFESNLYIQSISKVRLLHHGSTQLMKQIGDSVEVAALIRNEGNNREEVNITASFPNLMGGNIIKHKTISLPAFQDTVVSFKRIITKELLEVNHYTVNIAALYANGDLINNIMVPIQNAAGARTYRDPLQQGFSYNSFSPNSISVSGRNLFTGNEAVQINGRGTFNVAGGSLAFNMDSYIYTRNNLDPLVTDTYFNYERKNTGIVLGSLSESLETFINGRGVKLYHRNENETQSIEIGIADKSYNLLGSQGQLVGDRGYTVFANAYFNNHANKKKYQGSVIYDRSDLHTTESLILMNDYAFQFKNELAAAVQVGGGLTRTMDGNSNYEPSLALGAKLNGSLGEYNITSNNFYSSGYYPGTRRGLAQFNERISRRFNKATIWFSYNYYNHDPNYLKRYFLFNSESTSNSLEAGTSIAISNNFNMSITGKHQLDQAYVNSYIGTAESQQKLKSWRLAESFSWKTKNEQHMFNFSSENGFGQLTNSGERQLQVRASFLWNYRTFTLNAYYQRGSFSVREAVYMNNDRDVSRLNISPTFYKSFLNNRLKTSLSVNFNRDSYVGDNWSFSTDNSYAFSKRFSGFLNVHVYDYKNTFYRSSSFVNMHTGISYKLPAANHQKPGKRGNIELFLFFDKNTNGVFDEGDIPASDRIVKIGAITFISLADGSVVYKKVPHGAYTIEVPSSDWYANIPEEIYLNTKNYRLDIPLQETGRVAGEFVYNYDERLSEEVNSQLGGLRVWLLNDEGNRISALSNTLGQFTVFAPLGEYVIQVDEDSLPDNVFTEFTPQKINIEKGEASSVPTIELKVKQKKVEVKRFSS